LLKNGAKLISAETAVQ